MEFQKLQQELETAKREIAYQKSQMKMAQQLIATQTKYMEEAETKLKRLQRVEKENLQISKELEEEKKLRIESNDLAVNLQRLLLEFERVKKKPHILGLEAKLIAKSTEDEATFDANVKVIFKQINNFCGSIKTSLNIMKNHQKEKRADIETIVRKLADCSKSSLAGENNTKDDTDKNEGNNKEDVDISVDVEDDVTISDDVTGTRSSDTKGLVKDCNETSCEDKDESDNSLDANNDSGVSCFDPIELDDEPEAVTDSLAINERKSIRKRRPSANLRDYVVPRKTLEIHQGQTNCHIQKNDDQTAKPCGKKHKSKKYPVEKDEFNSSLKRGISCKLCPKIFKSSGRLKRHMKHHSLGHSNKESHSKRKICYTCGQFFPNKESLNSHQLEYHADIPEENPQRI